MAKHKITYKKLDDGTWGAWIPAYFGDVELGEDIYVSRRNGQKNLHTVATIVKTYYSGVVVTLASESDEPKTETKTVAVESELDKDVSQSNIFKIAHKLTKATIQDGDAYIVNFGAALKYVLSIAKLVKAKNKMKAVQNFNSKASATRAQIYDDIMNEGYSDAGNFNPYRNQYA